MKYNSTEIGNRLRILREKENLSQEKLIEKLANKSGEYNFTSVSIGRNTLSDIENGKIEKAKINFFIALSEIYRCDVSYLLCEYNDGKSRDLQYIYDETGLSENAVEKLNSYSKDELYPKELISRLLSEESFYRVFFKINKYLILQKMESSETREYNLYLIDEIEKNEYIPNEIKLFEMFKNRLSPNELSAYFILEATKQIEGIFRHWGYLEKYEKK